MTDHIPIEEKYPMIRVVSHIVGLFDATGVNHGRRVALMSMSIGMMLGMDENRLELLEVAALLHDVGKAGVPEYIRIKPGKLVRGEEIIMRMHPAWGLEILEMMNSKMDQTVRDDVVAHHENWDGSGYPSRLKGSEIPYGARIIRIADTYDAMTHSRGIRSPFSHSEAVDVMIRDQGDGNLFDPEIFRFFLTMMKGKNYPPSLG